MTATKVFSFKSWDSDHPRDRPPGERIDAQFDAHANAIHALEARLDALVRADGKLHAEVIPFLPKAASRAVPLNTEPPNTATLTDAASENWADVSMNWAEHMPDTIPGNILATNAITGDHWSARWWANQAAAFVGGMVDTTVTMVQMRKALVATGGGAIYTTQNAISSDIADPVNIAWNASSVVTPGDVLAVAIQAALAYSNAQMNTLFALARTL